MAALDLAGEELGSFDDDKDPTTDPQRSVDVGALEDDLDLPTTVWGLDEGGQEVDDDMDLELDSAVEIGDAGEEGTDESPEDEVDEAKLPTIDDDADASTTEDDFAEMLLSLAVQSETLSIARGPLRWTPLEGAGAHVPCWDVSVALGRVVAAGDVLMVVDEGGRTARRLGFGEQAAAVALAFDGLVVRTGKGELLLGQHGQSEPRRLASFQAELTRHLSPASILEGRDPGIGARSRLMAVAGTAARAWVQVGEALYAAGLARPTCCGASSERSPRHRCQFTDSVRTYRDSSLLELYSAMVRRQAPAISER